MASSKESPRQKMIGMMYLVLTALLALNVSKEILKAFVVINKGLENTNINFFEKNEKLYTEFDLAKTVDPVKVIPYWNKAQAVKQVSSDMTTYLDDLKKELMKETEGIPKQEADTLQLGNAKAMDNYDAPTHLLIGASEDGSQGKARELKTKLESFRERLMGFVEEEDKKNINIGINTDAPLDTEVRETWETYNFYHAPLAASVTILSKLQSDIRNAEYVIVDYLLKQFNGDILPFDTIAAKVIPQSNYVLMGEKYKADVFIAAFNKTKNPEILVGDYDAAADKFNSGGDSIEVEKGQGKYEAASTKEGIIKWGGVVKVKTPKNKIVSFPFTSEYIVARPALTVSAEKMNVLYMGVENPVSVSVPGIPAEKLKVNISNGATMVPLGNGKFMVKNVKGQKIKVAVSATLESGETRNMGEIEFRVKPLPKPFATYAGVDGGKVKKNTILVNKGVIAKYQEDFVFDLPVKVTSFRMSVEYRSRGNYDEDESKSNAFTQKMNMMVNNTKKGDRIYLENITSEGGVHLPPINIIVD